MRKIKTTTNICQKIKSREKYKYQQYKDLKPYYKFDCYGNSCYVSVRKDTNFDNFKDKQMVCFNDTQLLSLEDFADTKQRMLDFLESKLPNKSSFEK